MDFDLQDLLHDMRDDQRRDNAEMKAMMQTVAAALTAHKDHDTERFAPLEATNRILVWGARTVGVAAIGGLVALMFTLLNTR